VATIYVGKNFENFISSPNFGANFCHGKIELDYYLGDFIKNTIGHPDNNPLCKYSKFKSKLKWHLAVLLLKAVTDGKSPFSSAKQL
jgi:hypothetical protein